MLHFASSSSNVWLTFQAKNNAKSTPACTALTYKVLHQIHNACTANRYLRGKGERDTVQRRTKVSFGRTMMQALELQWLSKRHVSGRSDVEQWRNQGCSYSSYRVTLVWMASVRESVNQSVSQSVENKKNLKFRSKFWDWLGMIWRHFWFWQYLTYTA